MEGGIPMDGVLEQVAGEVADIFRALSNGFQKLDRIKDPNRQSKQLEELTGKMRECKRLIKEFDREIKERESRNSLDVNKQLNEKKQSMIKELNSYVALRKTYTSSLVNKRVELFDMGAGGSDPAAEDRVQMASDMTNQELIHAGMKKMDETDQTIARSKLVVEQTIEVGTQTATTLKGQTEQMGRIVNELDTIHFSIKKATQLVKELARQLADSAEATSKTSRFDEEAMRTEYENRIGSQVLIPFHIQSKGEHGRLENMEEEKNYGVSFRFKWTEVRSASAGYSMKTARQ